MRSAILVFVIAAGCSSYDPSLGPAPFLCGDNGSCPSGYTCNADSNPQVCLAKGATAPDASIVMVQCADDSNLEGTTRNDDIQHAFQTPVATQRAGITFAMVAICPEGDRDTYAIQVTSTGQNLETYTTWDSGQPVSVSILNNGGSSIANGVAQGDKKLRAYVPNLPMGTFFVQAFAGSGVKNNYSITINLNICTPDGTCASGEDATSCPSDCH